MTSAKVLAFLLAAWILLIANVQCNGQTNVRTVRLRVVYKGEATLWCDEFNDHIRPRKDKEDDDDDDDEGYDREEEEKKLKEEKEFLSDQEQVRDSEWKDFAFYKKVTEFKKPENDSNAEPEKIVTVTKIEEDDEKYFIYQSENKLTIKNLRRADIIGVEYFCNSSVNNSHIDFKTNIKPFLMNPEKPSATVMRDENAELSCRLLYGFEHNQKITWIWERDEKVLVENDTIIFEYEDDQRASKLLLRNVTEEMKGTYTCKAKNKYGVAEQTLLLRVKNPWAAIWPLFGIILQLIILLLIISFCARRQKRTRLPSS